MNTREELKNPKQIIPGIKAVLEQLEKKPEQIDFIQISKAKGMKNIDKILDLCRQNKIRFQFTEEVCLNKLFSGKHQGIIAQIKPLPFIDLQDLLNLSQKAPLPVIIAFDEVQDPGNIGTLCRTFYALGGAGIIITKHNSAYLGASAIKSSCGALPLLSVAQVTNLSQAIETAKKQNFFIYATGYTNKSKSFYQENLQTPALLVLGNEEKGIRINILKHCDSTLHIPFLRKFNSINISQAGAIILSKFTAKFQA